MDAILCSPIICEVPNCTVTQAEIEQDLAIFLASYCPDCKRERNGRICSCPFPSTFIFRAAMMTKIMELLNLTFDDTKTSFQMCYKHPDLVKTARDAVMQTFLHVSTPAKRVNVCRKTTKRPICKEPTSFEREETLQTEELPMDQSDQLIHTIDEHGRVLLIESGASTSEDLIILDPEDSTKHLIAENPEPQDDVDKNLAILFNTVDHKAKGWSVFVKQIQNAGFFNFFLQFLDSKQNEIEVCMSQDNGEILRSGLNELKGDENFVDLLIVCPSESTLSLFKSFLK